MTERPTPTPKKLYRNTQDKMIAGICSGIADYFEADVTLIRLLAVVVLVVSGGSAIIAYLIGAFVIPPKPIDL